MISPLSQVEIDRVVQELHRQQHVRPHQPLEAALVAAQRRVGFCPDAAREAVGALKLDSAGKIGRLRNCEMVQLARVICRIWRKNAIAASTGV